MTGLDRDARMILEDEIDRALKEPQTIERAYKIFLRAIGIEPELDTILSFMVGVVYGRTADIYALKYKRWPSQEELSEFIPLLKRRVAELRESFFKTRIEK
ncbi:MAG: hypothetical protein QXX08_07660 [Candidatus Bathyarchaeia archaeon]